RTHAVPGTILAVETRPPELAAVRAGVGAARRAGGVTAARWRIHVHEVVVDARIRETTKHRQRREERERGSAGAVDRHDDEHTRSPGGFARGGLPRGVISPYT